MINLFIVCIFLLVASRIILGEAIRKDEQMARSNELKVKERITFEVSDTVHVYKAGEAKAITMNPSVLSADDFVVKYYEVDENNGALKSTLPVSRAIATGCYLYVIDLESEQEDYGISSKFNRYHPSRYSGL